jgi:uncharacterized MAPEG superfamily protein
MLGAGASVDDELLSTVQAGPESDGRRSANSRSADRLLGDTAAFAGSAASPMNAASTELLGLVAAAALGLVHIVLASHSASFQRGYRWSAGPRDEPFSPLDGVAGRLARANANFLETFPFFAAAILAVIATGAQSPWSRWGVFLYLGGRIAYLPLYAFGVVLVRSIAWNVAIAGIAAVYVGLFV